MSFRGSERHFACAAACRRRKGAMSRASTSTGEALVVNIDLEGLAVLDEPGEAWHPSVRTFDQRLLVIDRLFVLPQFPEGAADLVDDSGGHGFTGELRPL